MNGALVRRRMIELRLKDADLIAKLKLSPTTVSKLKRGLRVSDQTAFDAARALEVDLEELDPEAAKRIAANN